MMARPRAHVRQEEVAKLLVEHLVKPGLEGACQTLIRQASRKWKPNVQAATFIARVAHDLALRGVPVDEAYGGPSLMDEARRQAAATRYEPQSDRAEWDGRGKPGEEAPVEDND